MRESEERKLDMEMPDTQNTIQVTRHAMLTALCSDERVAREASRVREMRFLDESEPVALLRPEMQTEDGRRRRKDFLAWKRTC